LQTKNIFHQHFKLKVLGDLKFFLGLELSISKEEIFMNQKHYDFSLLKDCGMLECKPSTIPMDPNLKLVG